MLGPLQHLGPALFGHQPIEQQGQFVLVDRLQPFAFRLAPFVVEAGQELALINRHAFKQLLSGAVGCHLSFQNRDVQPMFSSRIEGDYEIVGNEVITLSGFQRFADAPQRLAQIAARVGFGGVRPQQAGQFFAALRGARPQSQIG